MQHAVAHREETEHVACLREDGRAVDDLRLDALLAQQRAQGQSGDARAYDQNPHPSASLTICCRDMRCRIVRLESPCGCPPAGLNPTAPWCRALAMHCPVKFH